MGAFRCGWTPQSGWKSRYVVVVSPLGHRFLIVFSNFQGLGGHPPIFRHTQITILVLYPINIRSISHYPIVYPIIYNPNQDRKVVPGWKKKVSSFPMVSSFLGHFRALILRLQETENRLQLPIPWCYRALGATAGRVPPNMAIGVKWWSTTGFNATGHIFKQSCLFSLYSVLLWSIRMGGLSNHVQPAVLCQKVMQWCFTRSA